MNKKIRILLIIILLIAITGCGNSKADKDIETNNDSNVSTKVVKKKLTKKDLSIKDFEWEVSKTYINNKKYYALSLTNNSKYDLFTIGIYYRVKKDVTEEELKLYNSFMKEHKEWIYEDTTNKDVTLVGYNEKLVKTEETIDKIILHIGVGTSYWYNTPKEEQFNLMEPERLTLGVIGEDNKIYIAYYDFTDESWYIENTSKEVNVWSDNEIANKITEPTVEYYIVTSNRDDNFDFTAFGVTKDYFKEYVQLIKDAGFTEDDPLESDSYYIAEDKDGVSINISYDEEKELLDVSTYHFNID